MAASDGDRIAELEEQLRRALAEITSLREQLVKVNKALDEWKRGHRERSKRRTSRAEGRSCGERKRPGRKPGHRGAQRPVPKPDRQVQHPLPTTCSCGGHVEPTDETQRTIVQDIPPIPRPENVEHVAPVGRCVRCGRRVVAKLPGAVEAGQSVAKVQLGPNAQAMIVELRYDLRMPLQGISHLLDGWFGLHITPGGICQMLDRWRDRSVASYAEIQDHIRTSAIVGMDETGLRQDGSSGWAWLARTQDASLFRVELSRGSWVAESMLGDEFKGVLCTDFYSVYTARDDLRHGYCGGHIIREVKKIAEISPSCFTIHFCEQIRGWYVTAKQAQQQSSPSERDAVRAELEQIIARPAWDDPEVLRICSRIHEHFEGVVAFIDNPAIAADNNGSERDIRPIAVIRKVTGGTRSANGSRTLAHWMSLTQTLRKNGLPVRGYVVELYHAHLQGRPPPSVFAPN